MSSVIGPKEVKDIKKWIAALRSGKYKQTNEALQDTKGYCCLGVACDLFIPEDKLLKNYGIIAGGMPNQQEYAPEWLKEINADFEKRSFNKRNLNKRVALVTLNDKRKYTFKEIAAALEATYVKPTLANFNTLVKAAINKNPK